MTCFTFTTKETALPLFGRTFSSRVEYSGRNMHTFHNIDDRYAHIRNVSSSSVEHSGRNTVKQPQLSQFGKFPPQPSSIAAVRTFQSKQSQPAPSPEVLFSNIKHSTHNSPPLLPLILFPPPSTHEPPSPPHQPHLSISAPLLQPPPN